jgi:hypothetical protein
MLYNESVWQIVPVYGTTYLIKEVTMAFSFKNTRGVTYFLHSKVTTTKTGKTQTLFFFAKEVKTGALNAVPQGYKVAETTNGLPVLKKV